MIYVLYGYNSLGDPMIFSTTLITAIGKIIFPGKNISEHIF